ncbi:MAG: SDR family oxidoreductase [Hyphomicrobiales bacterium]
MALDIFSLAGKRALVTGSSQGIGLAIAEGLARAGGAVILNGRDPRKLAQAQKDLQAKGITAQIAQFDVTIESEVTAAVGKIETEQGPLDILVNNAGMQFRTPLEEFPLEKWRELMRVNVESAFIVGKAVAKGMIARRRGKIINISSVQSELGRPTIAPYTATKGAIKMLTKGMCADWAKHNIQVNAIGPGYFKTPLNQALVDNPEFSSWLEKRTPAGRWGTTDELIGAAVFLASGASSFVNGHILYVDGGITSVL